MRRLSDIHSDNEKSTNVDNRKNQYNRKNKNKTSYKENKYQDNDKSFVKKEPKKARQIEIPENRIMSEKEYQDIFNHAKNSASYYCSMSAKSEQEIKEKLLSKGYIEEDIKINAEDSLGNPHEYTVNIIDDTIEYLQKMLLVDDERLAENIVESSLRKGKGASEIRKKMFEKKINKDISQEHLDSLSEEEDSEKLQKAVETAAEKYMRKSAYRREEDSFKRDRKLYTFLMQRGFSISQIKHYLENKEDIDES